MLTAPVFVKQILHVLYLCINKQQAYDDGILNHNKQNLCQWLYVIDKMAKEYFDKLSTLVNELDIYKEIIKAVEVKHFFIGAALYVNQRPYKKRYALFDNPDDK